MTFIEIGAAAFINYSHPDLGELPEEFLIVIIIFSLVFGLLTALAYPVLGLIFMSLRRVRLFYDDAIRTAAQDTQR